MRKIKTDAICGGKIIIEYYEDALKPPTITQKIIGSRAWPPDFICVNIYEKIGKTIKYKGAACVTYEEAVKKGIPKAVEEKICRNQ